MFGPETFRFIKGRNDIDGVLDRYKTNNIVCIWDEKEYYVFNSKDEKTSSYSLFETWYNSRVDKHYHEIVFGQNPQRLKFDIDSTKEQFEKLGSIETVLTTIIEAIKTELLTLTKNKITNNDFVLADSCGGEKVSFHIMTLRYVVENNREAILITKNILANLPQEYHKLIDTGVNSSTHNFRLLNSHKVNSDRVKKVNAELSLKLGLNKTDNLANYMIHPAPKCRTFMLTSRCEPIVYETKPDINVPKEISDYIASKHFRIRDIDGNQINCNRVKSTYCDICEKTHDNDNTMVVRLKDGFYYEYCRKYHGEAPKSIRINEIDYEEAAGPEYNDSGNNSGSNGDNDEPADRVVANNSVADHIVAEKPVVITQYEIISKMINEYKYEKDPHVKTYYELLTNNEIYTEPVMRPYNIDCSVVAIQAALGLGKTVMLKKLYEENYKQSNAVFITFRRTFSAAVNREFPDFVQYNTVSGDINLELTNKLIIQVESLHRLKVSIKPDLLILDEIESILSQFTSNLHKALNASFANFCWLLRNSKKVIIMDGYLSDRSYNILQNIRPTKLDDFHFHWNKYKRVQDTEYRITNNHKDWLNVIMESIKIGKKVVINSNNKIEADTLHKQITELYPSKSIILYTADTSESIKSLHFSDVNKYWIVDVLIYSPCLSAGVSFVKKHFDLQFSYMTDQSCDVETCLQMTGRVRNIGDKINYICFKSQGESNLPTDIKAIEELIKERKSMDLFDIPADGIEFQINDACQIEYYHTPFFNLWLNNVSNTNMSKNCFIRRYIRKLTDEGGKLSMIPLSDITELECDYKRHKAQLQTEAINAVANAMPIDDNTAHEIKCRMNGTEDIDLDQKLSYSKWRLAHKFDVEVVNINSNFVSTYDKAAEAMYDNLTDILSCETLEESLSKIKEADKEQYNYVLNITQVQAMDLITNKNKFSSHNAAVKIIKLLGFDDITKTGEIKEIGEKFTSILQLLQPSRTLNNYLMLFEIRKFNIKFVEQLKSKKPDKFNFYMCKFIREVLKFYGLNISKKKDKYFIENKTMKKLFNFDPSIETDKVYIRNNRAVVVNH